MGNISTSLYLLVAVAIAFVLVRPCYRLFAPKVRLPKTSELVANIAFFLMVAPLSALILSVLSIPLLAMIGWVLERLAPEQLSAIEGLFKPFPSWVPPALWFGLICLAIFVNGLRSYIRSEMLINGDDL